MVPLTNPVQLSKVISDTKHGPEINNSFTDFIGQLIRDPQSSLLAPFLFNIYIWDLFFFMEEENVTSYADNTTRYSKSKNVTVLNEIKISEGKLQLVSTELY